MAVDFNVIVMGASAGGIEAARKVVRDLPPDLPAAVFLVIHISPESPSLLAEIISRAGKLPAVQPENGQRIETGKIYVAPPDFHLLLQQETIAVVRGPKENRHRPAIDPLFRSAARFHGSRVVGILLSGLLDDGTVGMRAIKRCGGTAIIQDPKDALFGAMPANALKSVKADYCIPAAEMAPHIIRLANAVSSETAGKIIPPKDLEVETEMAEMKRFGVDVVDSLGSPSVFTCPECNGALWELRDDILRYRCHTGHAFTAESLVVDQAAAVERALWIAIKTLEERATLSSRLAGLAREDGRTFGDRLFTERAKEAMAQAASLREIMGQNGVSNLLDELQRGSSLPKNPSK